ncbi:MAG: M18 family aminopeptidase [Propionibacteriaceae bacterium]|jgi:aspartyl aminopeptidase|nr:M18 family aminopeptidase [Propionibacteriaceae bacterium]
MTVEHEHIADLGAFVAASPSSYHAAAEVAGRLVRAGFSERAETDPWSSAPGGHLVRRDGAVIAYWLPAELTDQPQLRIVGAHTDSPGFKLKPRPERRSAGWRQVGWEVYGGPLLNSWLDRELGLAGRLVTTDGQVQLVRTGPWLRIPQLAVHLDRSVNEQLHLDKQAHMTPVYGLDGPDAPDLMSALAAEAGCAVDDIAGHDLFAYDPQPGQVIGLSGELFASGRLDNLSSVQAGLTALLGAERPAGQIAILACFDHEEVGSASRSGAQGPFLEQVLRRLAGGLGWSADDLARCLARSWLISADAGHAVHPNYPERHDPDHRPVVNRGPLLKVNANQRYTTDALGSALWRRLHQACGLTEPPPVFVSNNAVPCGSTIGPLAATRLGLATLDVGVPLLSMHSARELAGLRDPYRLAQLLTAFYSGA